LFATADGMSMTTTGLRPAASNTRMRVNCTWFCPPERSRSWIACCAASPQIPALTCSICMKWNAACAALGSASAATTRTRQTCITGFDIAGSGTRDA
jgi:hypothetical protein